MTIALSSLRVAAEVDASAYVAGMNAKVSADKQGAASSAAVATAIGQTDARLNSSGGTVGRLSRQYIEGFGTAERFQKAIRDLAMAMETGNASTSQADAILDGLYRKFNLTASATDLAAKGQLGLAAAVQQANDRLQAQALAAEKAAAAVRVNAGMSGLSAPSTGAYAQSQARDRASSMLGSLGSPAPILAIANSSKLASHEVANLAAQFSDLGVQIASGQSPFMAMIQQGPQIGAVLGDRGVKGALSAVGQGLMSLLTPTNLALGGILLAGYGAVAAFRALSDETESLQDLMERSASTIDRVREAYDGAGDAAGKFVERSREVLTLQAGAELDKLQKQLLKWQQTFSASLATATNATDPLGNITGQSYDVVISKYSDFSDVISRFRDDVKAGRGDVRAFADEVASMGNATPALRDLADEIIRNVESGLDLATSVDKAAAAVARLSGAASLAQEELLKLRAGQRALDTVEGLKTDLSRVGDPRAQFIGRYVDQNKGAEPKQIDNIKQLASQLYEAQENQKKADEAARDAKSTQEQLGNAYDRAVASIEAQVAALDDQIAMVGMSAAEAAKYQTVRELVTAAEAAGKDVTAALRREYEAYGDQIAERTTQLEEMRRRQGALNDAVAGGAGVAYDVIDSLVFRTKSWEDALKDATNALLKMTLQAALLGEGPLASLFGTAGQNGQQGGFLGMLFNGLTSAVAGGTSGGYFGSSGYTNSLPFGGPRAEGGPVYPGRSYLVGERGMERFSPMVPGMIFPGGGQPPAAANGNMKVEIINQTTGKVDETRTSQERGPDGSTLLRLTIMETRKDYARGGFDSANAARYQRYPATRVG